MKLDYFISVCIFFVIFVVIGIVIGIKRKKASIETSFVLPFLGTTVATAISLSFMVGFIAYMIKTYTGHEGFFSGFSDDVIRVPALLGSLGLTYISIIEFIKLFRDKK